ncbi:MAG: hypothetical protein ACLQAT_20160 [Candidatus Binataceae bacterium]
MRQAHYTPGTFLLTAPPGTPHADTIRRAKEQYFRELREELDALEAETRSDVLDRIGANLEKTARRRKREMTKREVERKQDLLSLLFAHLKVRELLSSAHSYLDRSVMPPSKLMTYARIATELFRELRAGFAGRALEGIAVGQVTQLHQRVRDVAPIEREMKAYLAAHPKHSYTKASEAVGKKLTLKPRWIRELVPKNEISK